MVIVSFQHQNNDIANPSEFLPTIWFVSEYSSHYIIIHDTEMLFHFLFETLVL